MSESQRFDRKNFLKLTLSFAGASAAGGWLVGCSDGEDPEGGAGSGGTNSAGAGAGGKAGSAGAGGGSSGSGTSGSAGSTAGTTTAGGNAGAAGKGGAGGGAGTVTGGAGSGPGGAGGTTGGAGGTTGGSAGTTGGTGGSAFGGAGSGGKGSGGSSGGSGGSAGGGGGGKCTAFTMAQEEECDPQCNPHDHIPDQMAARTQLFADLLAHITGPDALEPFLLPTEGPNGGHRHDIQFTQDELDTLLAGGTIMNKQKVPDDVDDHHEWTITVTCA